MHEHPQGARAHIGARHLGGESLPMGDLPLGVELIDAVKVERGELGLLKPAREQRVFEAIKP